MAQRQYPHDYNDRPDRIRDRERQWRQGRNAEYQARGWTPDVDRDSSLGEYYPTDNFNPDEEEFFDQTQLTGSRQPRSVAENRQTGYGYGYGQEGRGYRENMSGYGEERNDSMEEGYGTAYREAASRRRAAMLEPSSDTESEYYVGSVPRQGLGQSHRRPSGRDEQGRGNYNQGYSGPGYGDYDPEYQSRTKYSGISGYAGQSERAARGYQETSAGQPDYRGRGPKNYRRSDARIHEEVCERLSDDSAIDASEIDITVKDGVVQLEGSVESRRMKHRAEDVVAECSGVKDIENRLTATRAQAGSNLDRSTTQRTANQ